MRYCLNPACPHPKNLVDNTYCQGCGEVLATSTQSYLFRLHYRITQFLGEGAFGRTYLAEDTDLMGEPRVIKKLIANTSGPQQGKIRELFLREAKQLHNIRHPQIPKLYAYFEQNSAMYLVQEFIEGDNLFQEFSKTGTFSAEKIKSLLQDLLPVVDYLHSNKILHRDIKPQNIMRCQKTGHLILIDFGGVKRFDRSIAEMIENKYARLMVEMIENKCARLMGEMIEIKCARLMGEMIKNKCDRSWELRTSDRLINLSFFTHHR